MAFDRRSASKETLLDAFRLEEGVEEPDSLKSKVFSIISCKASISFFCLVYADAMAAMTAEVTTQEIKCCIVGSIAGGDMPKMSSWNCDTGFE